MDKVKIGFPIEYECDGIIYDGIFLREPEIEELEKRLKEINKITELKQQVKEQQEVIDKAIEYINQHFKHHPELLTENQIEYELIRKIENILKEVSE